MGVATGGDQFAGMAGAVAKELLGEPNKALSSASELRFGNKGSLSVDLKKGVWADHSDGTGGGVIALIERETGKKGRDAIEWLRDHGFTVEDNRSAPQQGSNRNYSADDHQPQRHDGPEMKPVKTWDYVDENGGLIFQVVRLENGLIGKDGKPEKTYRQRKPDDNKRGGWDWSTKGVRQVPYRLPDLLEAVSSDYVVFVVEGEKAADRLLDLGVPATTNARGAGKWPDELTPFFTNARIVILPDNDPQAEHKDGRLKFDDDGRPVFVGQDHAEAVATKLDGIAKDVRILPLPDLPLKGDVVEWLEAGGTVDQLYDLAAKAARFERAPFQSKFHAVTWSKLDDPGPEHEWLIKGLITRGETSMVAGPSKSGKSFLVLDISLAIARGTSWMGRKSLQGGVVYQAGEGARGIKKRLRAYRKHHGLTSADDIPFVLLPARLDLYNSSDHTDAFIDEVMHWSSTFAVPLELIVIDTWATATPGANENDGKDVSIVLERCARIALATGAAVLLVHHMNADGAKVRGHTSILANLENVLIVKPLEAMHDDDNRQIRHAVVDKNKDGEGGTDFRFVLGSVNIGMDEDGDPITSCVVLRPNGDASDQPIPEKTSITDAEALLLRAIEKAIDENGTKPPQSTGLPQYLRVVEWKQALTAYDSISFDAETAENEDQQTREKRLAARRQSIKRSGERLMRKGVIARDNPWVWLTGKPIKGYRKPITAFEQPAQGEPAPHLSDQDYEAAAEVWGGG